MWVYMDTVSVFEVVVGQFMVESVTQDASSGFTG